ncbi:hypothetical protein Avbf_17193 [Armadillidium vulgare]|nr:hypothetical protein Avbf_17193 [Armadillidium vulgare]
MYSINNWFLGYNMFILTGNLLEYWQPRIEKKNKREPIYTIKTYTHPITNFTNLLTMEGRKTISLKSVSQRIRQSQGQSFTRKAEAIEELNGGDVTRVMCSCTEYQVDTGEKLCSYCGPVPFYIQS